MTDTTTAQLRRILALIPECADDRTHPIADVAARAGVAPNVLLKDIRALADRFDDPGGFVESVAVFLEPDRFQVRSEHFLRPMRLTVAEVGALELGLALLAHERPPEELPVLSRARDRLHAALAKLPNDDIPDGIRHAGAAAAADPEALAGLRRAYRESRKVRIDYLKADAESAASRVVCPFAIVAASGRWYLVGRCEGVEGIRVYRVDRIQGHEVLDERYELPETFDVGQAFAAGRAFVGEAAEAAEIRFTAPAGRWVAEREGKTPEPDGSYVQTLSLADLDWLARYVLQYGGAAEVIGPPRARAAVRERLQSILDTLPA
jgi:proteasome accessory factor C